MRRLKQGGNSGKTRPSDKYAQYGKPAAEREAGSGVSHASFDDLFGASGGAAAPSASDRDAGWAEYEETLSDRGLPRGSTLKRGTKGGSKAKPKPASDARSAGSARSGRSTKSSKKGSRAEEDDDGEDVDMDEEDDGDSAAAVSHASFEEVFGRRVFDDGAGDGDGEEFEFSNPTGWRDAAAAKDAVFDVLSKGGSTMQMARKLYLLEQLNRAAPPSEAPSYWSRRGVLGGPRASRRRKAKGHYEVQQDEEAFADLPPPPPPSQRSYWALADVVANAAKLDLEWVTRVEFLLDLARHVGKLHQGGFVHGSLRSDALLLDDRLTLHLKQVKTLRQLTKKEATSELRTAAQQLDSLGIGVVILELGVGQSLAQMPCPKLRAAIKQEEKGRFDKLEELAEAVDKEVRALLHGTTAKGSPTSLVELASQCLSPMRDLRPTADDVLDWLGDLKQDMTDEDAPRKRDVVKAFVAEKKLAFKPAKAFDMSTVPDLGDLEDGYETDDSYAPPPDAEDSGGVTKKQQQPADGNGKKPPPPPRNKLQAFLQTSGDAPHLHGGSSGARSVAGDGRARPQSMMLPSKMSSMLDEEAAALKAEQRGASDMDKAARLSRALGAPKKLTRRRSLDRGYYYARARLMEQEAPPPRQLVSKANLGKFKQQWQQKQKVVSARDVDPEELGRRFDEQEVMSQDEASAIVKMADAVLRQEPNLIQLSTAQNPSITVVGDIHGQFYDLRNLMRLCGPPGKGKGQTTYLFLGDFIDRGDWGCESMLYLLALKYKFPAYVWLLRGNHEARTVSSYFGFKEECERKYGLAVFNRFTDMFQALPIAATVETPAGKWLALHGGISPNVQRLDQFVEFDRFAEPAMNGFLCDVLWSDPVKDTHEDGQTKTLADFLSIDFLPNPQRGCSYRYGFRAIVSFLARNGLVGLLRAHEVQEEGYLYHYVDLQNAQGGAVDVTNQTPPVVTVFSAPNYCGRYGNKGAVLRLHHKPPGRSKISLKRLGNLRPLQLMEPIQFTAVPHPDPLQLENAQRQQTATIETTCPYMPTTFHAFLSKATELGKQQARRSVRRGKQEGARSSARRTSLKDARDVRRENKLSEKAPPLPPRSTKTSNKGDDDGEDDGRAAPQRKNWKAAALLGFDDPGGMAPPPEAGVKGKKAAKPKPKKKKKKNKKFEEAAAQDGINELNPLLVQDKMKQAASKLKPDALHLPGKVRVKDDAPGAPPTLLRGASLEDMTSAAALAGSRRSGGGSMAPSRGKAAAALAAGKGGADDDAVTFSQAELVSLQLLFLFIDQQDKGFITRDDLVQWSAEEGYAVQKSEADACMDYVDADGDGQIGFEDYLVFAAKNKEAWLIKQYNQVLGNIKKMEAQGSSPALALASAAAV